MPQDPKNGPAVLREHFGSDSVSIRDSSVDSGKLSENSSDWIVHLPWRTLHCQHIHCGLHSRTEIAVGICPCYIVQLRKERLKKKKIWSSICFVVSVTEEYRLAVITFYLSLVLSGFQIPNGKWKTERVYTLRLIVKGLDQSGKFPV